MARGNPLDPIPHPPRKPLIGNLLSVSGSAPVQDLVNLARENGPIYWLDMMGKPVVVVSGHALVDELCDEARFDKSTRGALRRLRPLAHGLFTSDTKEPNWSKAHHILLPTFAQRAMQGYHAAMLDLADQLVLKWERLNADDEIDVTDDMTRLTLDTIGLCGFDYRFNSFYRDGNHPFVDAMARALGTTMETRGLPLEGLIHQRQFRQLRDDIRFMHGMVETIITERREAGHDATKKDLMSLMLSGVDKRTGQRLDDRQIRDETITFLIAGHETTSGLLSFATYALLNNPDVLEKCYAEVDRVLGGDLSVKPTYAQVNQLTYIAQVLKETLRLWPTAPAYGIGPLADTTIGGKYKLKKRYHLVVLTPMLHRDKTVWGEDAELFNPDNFSREAEMKRPIHAYKPFGNGQRACIGRQFALQEAALVMGMVLQRFNLIDHKRYELKIKETLTIKPDGLKIKVRPRSNRAEFKPSAPIVVSSKAAQANGGPGVKGEGRALTILYGTSLGTCRDIANQIQDRAAPSGFEVKTGALDDFADGLPESGTLIVVTSTYNGKAPDSAMRFETAIAEKKIGEIERPDLTYAVLGCGNTQWRTYQAFPKVMEATLRQTGAKALLPRGEADGNGDFDEAVERWMGALWKALGEGDAPATAPAGPRLTITFSDAHATRTAVLPEQAYRLQVVGNDELVRDATGLWDFAKEAPRPSTRHMTIRLPKDVSYRAGDHLAVYARNRPEVADKIIERLGLTGDTVVQLDSQSSQMRHLPVGKPVTVRQLLTDFVELQDAATRKDVRTLIAHTRCPVTLKELDRLGAEDEEAKKAFTRDITDKRVTIYDLLMRYPAIELPLEGLLEMTAAIRPRFYSISSSPLAVPDTINLTVGTVAAPAWSGSGFYQGVASSFLQQTKPGEEILGFVRRPNPAFAPPEDPETPMILIGPGTGFAPLRGFLQERAAQAEQGMETATSLLFYGCRHPQHDWFYGDEMKSWEQQGVAKVHLAFSSSDASPHRFVQEALWGARDEVWQALEADGMVYVCGDGRFMAPAVRETLIRIHMERRGTTLEQSSTWLEGMIESGRYNQDVFGFK
jgi:cytochrome P450 / NADPH-cytochrome P450 reductase